MRWLIVFVGFIVPSFLIAFGTIHSTLWVFVIGAVLWLFWLWFASFRFLKVDEGGSRHVDHY